MACEYPEKVVNKQLREIIISASKLETMIENLIASPEFREVDTELLVPSINTVVDLLTMLADLFTLLKNE